MACRAWSPPLVRVDGPFRSRLTGMQSADGARCDLWGWGVVGFRASWTPRRPDPYTGPFGDMLSGSLRGQPARRLSHPGGPCPGCPHLCTRQPCPQRRGHSRWQVTLRREVTRGSLSLWAPSSVNACCVDRRRLSSQISYLPESRDSPENSEESGSHRSPPWSHQGRRSPRGLGAAPCP